MQDTNVGIIVTARVGSTRLKNKVLQEINGRRAIDILLDHVVTDMYPVVLAIPDLPEDNILQQIAEERGIDFFRGFNDSPLHRLAQCADDMGFDYIVRVTADDILIDMTLLRNQVKMTIARDHEYVYMSRCPDGIAAEVIKTSALLDVAKKTAGRSIEYVSYELKNKYKTFEYYPPFEYQFPAKLTLDYEDDLTVLRILYSSMYKPGTLDIINFLKKNKWALDINHVPLVTVYTCNYNTAPYIADCMDSVFSQDFQDFEFIVLDDHSSDDSVNVIMEYYSRLPIQQQKKTRVVCNEKNIGLPASCNKVLTLARGGYIVRVDSDDRLHPDFLVRTTGQSRLDYTQAVLTGYTSVDEKLAKLNDTLKNMWHPACALLSRWVVNEIKYREGVQYCEGDIFYKEFRKHYKSSFIPDALWDYRQRPGQKTAQPDHPNNKGA
jgi:spore coat polysaccharide biosynthesis protein SpsF (cytidylyltransferase family)